MKLANKQPSIVVIGGGTGTFVVLRGLKKYNAHLTAIVTMSDSGGSNKRIRDEFGLLPTSDIRQCLVALSDESGGAGILRKLFMYRFEKGEGMVGMTFGNLFMAALSDILGSQAEAIKQTAKVLRIKGTVLPVSYTDTNLHAKYADGTILTEEHLIDEPPHDGTTPIVDAWLEPTGVANPDAIEAITNASLIVIGPGDLYTSILPNLLISEVAEAIKKSTATKVYVLNLMTKFGQTYNYTGTDHIAVLERYIGKSLTMVLVNNAQIPQEAEKLYRDNNELPVVDNFTDSLYYTVVRHPLINPIITKRSQSDTLVRSLIRHDSELLGELLIHIGEQ